MLRNISILTILFIKTISYTFGQSIIREEYLDTTKKEYVDLISIADKYYIKKNYKEAKKYYLKAERVSPYAKYPDIRVNEINYPCNGIWYYETNTPCGYIELWGYYSKAFLFTKELTTPLKISSDSIFYNKTFFYSIIKDGKDIYLKGKTEKIKLNWVAATETHPPFENIDTLSKQLTVDYIKRLNQHCNVNKTDNCVISISTWFQPACLVDTCTNTIWQVNYNDKCITKVLYKIYNPTKTKVIYKSNKIWSGKTGKAFPLEFYKADYYPYEITFYTNDKKTIVKKGKVYLHIL